MRAKMEKSSSGFTIIEIIFLVAVAGLVLGAVGSLLYSMIKAEENNENVLIAASLAQDVMERLRSVPYSELEKLFSDLGEDVLEEGIVVTVVSLPDFYAYPSISFLPPPPSLDNLPQIEGDSSKIIKLPSEEEENGEEEDEKGMEVVVEIKWKELPKELPKDDPNERSYRVATYFLAGGLNDYLSPTPSPTP